MTSRERMLMKKKSWRRRASEKRKGCGGGEKIRERRGGIHYASYYGAATLATPEQIRR